MKTSAELQTELDTLQAELQRTQHLANERSTRSYKVQSCTAGVVLGSYTHHDLEMAKAELDESVEAVIRLSHLKQSIADLRSQLTHAQGRERAGFCQGIKGEFDATYQTYIEQQRQLHQTHLTLRTLSNRYAAMTNVSLMIPRDSKLNLPALAGVNDWDCGIPTGAQ